MAEEFGKRLEEDLFPGTKSTTGIKEEKLVVFAVVLDQTSSVIAPGTRILMDKILVSFKSKKNTWLFEDTRKTSLWILSLKQAFESFVKKPLKLTNITENEINERIKGPLIASMDKPLDKTLDKPLDKTQSSLVKDSSIDAQKNDSKSDEADPKVNDVKETYDDIVMEIPVLDLKSGDSAIDIDVLFKESLVEGIDFSQLEANLNKELSALESANVHALLHASESSAEIKNSIFEGKSTLDDIGSSLTKYTTNLSAVGEEIRHIETLNKGLQQRIANQNKLFNLLQSIFDSIHVPDSAMEILCDESFDSIQGVSNMEEAADTLKKAIFAKVDPELANLKAIIDQKDLYQVHVKRFGVRLLDYCKSSLKKQVELAFATKGRFSKKGFLRLQSHSSIHESLSILRELFTWMWEMDSIQAQELQTTYQSTMIPLYRKEFKDFFESFRSHHLTKRPYDEAECFFSHQQKTIASHLNVGSFGKNLNLAKTLAGNASVGNLGGKHSSGSSVAASISNNKVLSISLLEITSNEGVSFDGVLDEKLTPDLGLRYVLQNVLPIIAEEMNFVKLSFLGLLKRKISVADLDEKQLSKIENSLKNMMEGLPEELFSFVETCLKIDNSYSLAMYMQFSQCLNNNKGAGGEYLRFIVEPCQARVSVAFEKFMEEQMRNIEEIKLDGKKRVGILNPVKIFPLFVAKMEETINSYPSDDFVRKTLDEGYNRLVKVIFRNLQVAGGEDANIGSNDIEEKEQQTFDVINIENHHHLYTQLRLLKLLTLENFVRDSKTMYDDHLNSYCQITFKRAMGKFYEFFDGIQDLLKTKTAEDVAFQPAYNKVNAKKVLSLCSGKEIRKVIETLYNKVKSHFANNESSLGIVVWRFMQDELMKKHDQYTDIVQRCYRDADVSLQFSREDILAAFTEMASRK